MKKTLKKIKNKKGQIESFLMKLLRYLIFLGVALLIIYLMWMTMSGKIALWFSGCSPIGGVG
jgi:hypothetical protein